MSESKTNEIAVVMPYRYNPNRDPYVLPLCIKAWLNLNPGKVILVDGSEEKTDVKIPEVEHVHVPYDGAFNLSFMRNVGGRRAADLGFKYVQMMDSDIFPTAPNYFEACLDMISKADMIRPFVINSHRKVPKFDSLKDLTYLNFLNVDMNKAGSKRYSYSTMFQNIKVLKAIHGWDEAFQMWGAEDDDYLNRARQAGFRPACLEGHRLIHSHHTNDTAKKAKQETDHYKKNYARWRQGLARQLPIIRMPDDWGLHPLPRTGQ